MKRNFLLNIAVLLSVCCFSQHDPVLMQINNKQITRSEFEYLYNKNIGIQTLQQKTLDEYIELFINYKLKVAEAEAAGIDTTAAFRAELNGYRRQLAKSYLTDTAAEDTHARAVYEERKRNGQHAVVEGMHIYKYLPQNTPVAQVNRIEQQMDSLYRAIINAPSIDFAAWVKQYSDDKEPFSISWLQMPEEFERIAFSLNSGEVSKPFFTPQGIHIIKIYNKKAIPSFEEAQENIKKQYARKYGITKGDEIFLNKIKAEYNYTPSQPAINELLTTGKTDKVLFTINDIPYTGREFARFSQESTRNLKRQFDDFTRKSLYDYETDRLESKHPEFRLLMQEYRDGMLLFEISNREVWNKAFNDKAGLQAYFATHQKDYYWELPRYKGIVIHCDSKKTAKRVKKQLKKIPEEHWVNFLNTNYNSPVQEKVKIEEGVYAVGQNDFVDKLIFKVGSFTPFPSHPFTVVQGRKIKGPESYEEVAGILTGDYQNFLENRWITRLRSKSRVEINEEVLKTVNNH